MSKPLKCENALFLANSLNRKLYPESRLPAIINELVARFSREDLKNSCLGNAKRAVLKPCLIKIFMLIWLLVQILKTPIQVTVTAKITIKLLLSLLNWRKWFSTKVSIARSENSPPRWPSSIVYTSDMSHSTTTTVSKTTWAGTTTYLFMLTEWGLWKQAAAWERLLRPTSFSIFTACWYLWDSEDKLISESTNITSELPNHSRASAITCVSKVIENMREKHRYLPLQTNVFVWGDGCATQFRSRFVFIFLSTFDKSVNLTWYYKERHHGKGTIDGVGGT